VATKKIVSAGPAGPGDKGSTGKTTFTPTPEAKGKATTYRLIAAGAWIVAIGLELFAIFWLLKHTELKGFMVWLIAVLVVIAVCALAGSLLWKKANRLDPASEKNKLRFFVQNQLGAIITILAFVPLIILIFVNPNMTKNQKALAGVVGIVLAAVVGYFGVDTHPPSVEQMDQQAAVAIAYTGQDQVYWVKGGSVYHLCAEYPAGTTIAPLSRGDASNDVIQGTVAQAVAQGKERLSMYGFSECGLTEGQPQYGTVDNPEPVGTTAPVPTDTPS
jgi:hypothetical protein